MSDESFKSLDEIEQNDLIEKENEIEKSKFEQKNINENKIKNFNVPSRKSSRNKKSPIRYPENECNNNIYVNFCKINTPNSYEKKAINCAKINSNDNTRCP